MYQARLDDQEWPKRGPEWDAAAAALLTTLKDASAELDAVATQKEGQAAIANLFDRSGAPL